jgi:hypothetical protein
MTSLVYVDRYGPPDYGVLKGRPVAVVLHTTEGNPGRAGAIQTAEWQATSGNSSGGSYHFVVGSDGDVCTAVRTVPLGHIAGSISTRRDAVWIADTDADLREYMGAAAVADPNAYVIAISMAGYTANFEANGWPQATVDGVARLIRMIEQHFGIADIYVAQHYRFQTNRSDPGRKLTPLVIAAYERLYGGATPAPSPTPQPTPAPATGDRPVITTNWKWLVAKHSSLIDGTGVRADADPALPQIAAFKPGTAIVPFAQVTGKDGKPWYIHALYIGGGYKIVAVPASKCAPLTGAIGTITQAELDQAKADARAAGIKAAAAAAATAK